MLLASLDLRSKTFCTLLLLSLPRRGIWVVLPRDQLQEGSIGNLRLLVADVQIAGGACDCQGHDLLRNGVMWPKSLSLWRYGQ